MEKESGRVEIIVWAYKCKKQKHYFPYQLFKLASNYYFLQMVRPIYNRYDTSIEHMKMYVFFLSCLMASEDCVCDYLNYIFLTRNPDVNKEYTKAAAK